MLEIIFILNGKQIPILCKKDDVCKKFIEKINCENNLIILYGGK